MWYHAPSMFLLPRLMVASWRRLRLEARARRHALAAPPLIRRLVVMTQNGCALRCRMCDFWLEEPRRLPRASIIGLLRSPALAPRASVSWTGGEPLLYPGFAELYAEARALRPDAAMDISTSGVPAAAVLDFASRPDAASATMVFSYDGAGAHDHQRGKPGAEEELLALIAEVRRRHPRRRLAVRMTLTRWNAHAVRPTFLRSRELGVELWFQMAGVFEQNTNSVRGAAADAFAPDAEGLSRLEADLRFVFRRLSLRTERSEIGHLDGLLRRLRGDDRSSGPPSCPVPSQSAFVRADGAVLTCRSSVPVGNVLTGGLEAAWASAASCALRRSGCGRCEPRYSEF